LKTAERESLDFPEQQMNAKHQLCHLDGTNGKGVCALAWKELLMELGVGHFCGTVFYR
jgi:hypothetical protein